jgi:transcription-repair coupling factor (superfamily II helicase)
MVTEAVGEMKGEPPKEPSELKLDVPTDAYLPTDYVTKEESRLEAYRRLAAVTSAAEVDDIRTEWEDRYGPVPEPADALLNVGYLRAECQRLGLRDVSIAAGQARLAPMKMKTSEEMRLQRLARHAIFKTDSQQLVVPMPREAEPAEFLVAFLRELIPA